MFIALYIFTYHFTDVDSTGTSEEWVAGEQNDLFKAVVEEGAGVEKLRAILDSGVDPSLTDSEVGMGWKEQKRREK